MPTIMKCHNHFASMGTNLTKIWELCQMISTYQKIFVFLQPLLLLQVFPVNTCKQHLGLLWEFFTITLVLLTLTGEMVQNGQGQ